MELTKEMLEERLKELMAQKERSIANVNACEGGIITIRGLLCVLDREEKDDSGETGSSPVSPEDDDYAVR